MTTTNLTQYSTSTSKSMNNIVNKFLQKNQYSNFSLTLQNICNFSQITNVMETSIRVYFDKY